MVAETSAPADALARACAGDESGFLELWRALQPRLMRYLRVVGCADPEDVASETWLQVVRDLPAFSGGEDEFRRWLFTIGRHRAVDAARARSRRPVTADVSLEGLIAGPAVEDQVLEGMSARQAVALLRRLPADQAEAVALRVLAGLDTRQVAGILGKSPGAVRVALHRGLRALATDPAVREIVAPGTVAGGLMAPGPAASTGPASGSATEADS